MGTTLTVAAVLATATLLSSMLSVELGISVAIIEILAGIAVGNAMKLPSPDWLAFLAGFGSVVLTFLAGAEVDPTALRESWKPSVLIGTLSFLVPFGLAMLTCRYLAGWSWPAAEIGGIALSTTSLAVVYAVLVETGLSSSRIGQLIMSSTFITDVGTVLALSVLFVRPTWWLVPFVAVSLLLIIVMPRGGLVLPPLRKPCDRSGNQRSVRRAARAHVARRPGIQRRRTTGIPAWPGGIALV
jgi:Kef-type K+ transport system membrane component KefB